MSLTRASLTVTATLALCFEPCASASEIGQEIAGQIDAANYQHYLDDLLFTHYGDDRGPDGPEHDLARDNIAATFESYGFEVELLPCYSPGAPDDTGYNVVATKLGALWPERQYVIGAHYDSVGNPGADDDASGVAGLLELARVYSQFDIGCTLKLIAFDAEETGLWGSRRYASEHVTDDIRGMIQLDMIAWDYLQYKVMIRAANDDTPSFLYDLDLAVDEYGGDLVASVGSPLDWSDHASFADQGFAACLLIEHRMDLNPCYHQSCDSVDEPDYISYDYASDIVRSVAGYLADVIPAYYADDCDQDGASDAQQILDDPSLDCNENGFLDECEPGGTEDCNANGIPDLCDIYVGTSDDLDGNIIPDECQPHRYVPAEYATIQAAIDAADAGDVIVVADDTYTGDGNINVDFLGKEVVLRSENGPENCIIDCAGAGRAFYVGTGETAAAVICGFTITNGYAATSGGAIACNESSPTILDCVLFNNTATDGGAIFCSNGRPTIWNCSIARNEADHGGGLCCRDARVTVEDSVISDNRASFGGGLYYEYGIITLRRCVIENNLATREGGGVCAVCVDNGSTIRGSRIADNSSAEQGGGIHFWQSARTLISSCEVSGNYADLDGGGMWIYVTIPMTIEFCAIRENDTTDRGGGVFTYASPMRFRACTITSNTAAEGAGIYKQYGMEQFTIVNCTITRNHAIAGGGGFYTYSGSSAAITNSILRYDYPDEVYIDDADDPVITYSVVQGGWGGVGNIDVDPMITDNATHLLADSPCINAGDPNGVYADVHDIDGEPRDGDHRVDIGPDEFYDVDADQLPDWWEQRYFGSPTAGDPAEDSDDDRRTNLQEYAKSSNPLQPFTTYYISVDGDDTWDGLAPEWDGAHGPLATIQAGIGAADPFEGDEVVVTPGVYTHAEFTNMLDFDGKRITLRSVDPRDPAIVAATILDRQGSPAQPGRVFLFGRGEGPDSVVTGITVQNGFASRGGAVRCRRRSSPTFVHCVFSGNHATAQGGALDCIEESRPSFDRCRFLGNTANTGGGAAFSYTGDPGFTNCLFTGNDATGYGGGALYVLDGDASLANCTLTGNAAPSGATLLCVSDARPGSAVLANCILWDDENGIAYDPNSVVTIAYSAIYGGWPGEGNLDADPLFLDPDGPDDDPNTWGDNDYHLSPGSPCIDAANNTAVPLDAADLDGDGNTSERTPMDLDGFPRFVDHPATDDTGVPDPPDYLKIVDMGAYEFAIFGDLDSDGDVDLSDLAILLAHYGMTSGAQYEDGDLDCDGDVDLGDLSALLAMYGTMCQ
jgi:hypothetical protein